METCHRLTRITLLLAMVTFCLVRTAPAGVQGQLAATSDEGKMEEAVKEVEKLEDAEEVGEKVSTEDKVTEDVGEVQGIDDQEEDVEEEEKVTEDESTDEGINDVTDDVIADVKQDISDEAVAASDDIITGSSSDPDATDYLWEPSYDYPSTGDTDLHSTWFLYDLPYELSQYEPSQWYSNSDTPDKENGPYYQDSYEPIKEDDGNSMDNVPALNVPLFNGIPAEELNNEVDETVDEVLCNVLGLCEDVRVYPDDGQEWEEPNEIQFTEEGMMGNTLAGEKTAEQDIDTKTEAGNEKTNNDTKGEDDDAASYTGLKPDVPASPSSGRSHRIKRDLSWDELEDDNDLLSKINQLDRLQQRKEEDTGEYHPEEIPAAERFEELLEYFKEDADSRGDEQDAREFYLNLPEPVLEELLEDAAAEELQEEEEEEEEAEEEEAVEEGLLEEGEFVDPEDDGDGVNNVAEADWGDYLAPGSPYIKDVLKYDGYKRDDEKEALKVYVESLQNLEGYRKRSNDLDALDEDSRAAADFLRQLVPRSPPDAVRRPKTGMEPFSREKYFPFIRNPEEEDDTLAEADAEAVLKTYNELVDLYNAEMEADALISTIQEMAAELGRDQRLLRELQEMETENELKLAMDADDQDILDFLGVENSRLTKRAPRMIDYPDFNEYPPEFHRSAQRIPRDDDWDLSPDELMRLYKEYLKEEAKDAKWGDYVEEPRERRGGEDSLPGPHGAYYVQGRMIGDLMKPKREWDAPNAVDGILEDQPAEADSERPYVLLDPSDLGYDAWPGDFDIFYDTRDGTYVLYPYPNPSDPLSVLSDETLQEANDLSGRNINVRGDDEEEEGNWGGFRNEIDLLEENLKEINQELDQLEDLESLAELAAKLKMEQAETDEEEDLLKALLGNE